MCPHCRAFITDQDKVCPYCNERVGARAVERRGDGSLLGGLIPEARFVTSMILLINIALYVASSMTKDSSAVLEAGAKMSANITRGQQYWRLVTAGFLHGGLFHILMNSWALFDLGAQIEEIFGASRMIVFYFVATIAGFYASTYWSLAPSVGSSAGIFGLIGAMIALGMMHRSALGDAIRSHYMRWAVYGLIMGALPGLHVDNAAHIGGLAGGFGLAWLAGQPGVRVTRERIWQAAAVVCLVLTAWSFYRMFLYFLAITQ